MADEPQNTQVPDAQAAAPPEPADVAPEAATVANAVTEPPAPEVAIEAAASVETPEPESVMAPMAEAESPAEPALTDLPTSDATFPAEGAPAAPDELGREPMVIGAQIASLQADAAVPVAVPDLAAPAARPALASIDLLDDVELDVRIELGRTQMYIEDVLRLAEGSVVELDKLAGDPVEVFVNDNLVARGEVLVLNESFCVRINDIISPTERGDSET